MWFLWKETLCEFTCLPFGLCSPPRAFTKLLKPVIAYQQELSIRLIVYLDDILILNSSAAGLSQDLGTVVDLLQSLWFLINWD